VKGDKNNAVKASLKALFAFMSILIVPVYTISFGSKESPFDYTLSNIGNFFNHNTAFIIWGLVTGLCLVIYLLYTFAKLNYQNKRARRYIISSDIFLFLTVITPAIKDIMPFYHFMHVVYSALFALFLVASIMLFIRYFSEINRRLGKLAQTLLLVTAGIPLVTLFFTGLNGIVEILFFVCISLFLVILNVLLVIADKKSPRQNNCSEQGKTDK